MKKFDKKSLGRDPTYGRVAFRTGRVLTLKDKLRDRSSKQSQKFRQSFKSLS